MSDKPLITSKFHNLNFFKLIVLLPGILYFSVLSIPFTTILPVIFISYVLTMSSKKLVVNSTSIKISSFFTKQNIIKLSEISNVVEKSKTSFSGVGSNITITLHNGTIINFPGYPSLEPQNSKQIIKTIKELKNDNQKENTGEKSKISLIKILIYLLLLFTFYSLVAYLQN